MSATEAKDRKAREVRRGTKLLTPPVPAPWKPPLRTIVCPGAHLWSVTFENLNDPLKERTTQHVVAGDLEDAMASALTICADQRLRLVGIVQGVTVEAVIVRGARETEVAST